MAGEQRRLAHASKRDSTAMKALSLIGAVFLPGTYLASLFSMTFFNFQDGKYSCLSHGSSNPLLPTGKYPFPPAQRHLSLSRSEMRIANR